MGGISGLGWGAGVSHGKSELMGIAGFVGCFWSGSGWQGG